MDRAVTGYACIAVLLAALFSASCATKKPPTYYLTKEGNQAAFNRVSGLYGYVLRSMNATGNHTFAIIKSDELDAMALCGKKTVLVTSGIVNKFDNYELGFVLAHEVSHLKRNHCLTRQIISGSISFLAVVAGAIVPGAGLADYAVNPLVTRGFSRSQEREADLDAAMAFKGAAEGGERALTKLKFYADLSGKGTGGGWLSTHPDVAERIQAMKEVQNGTIPGAKFSAPSVQP